MKKHAKVCSWCQFENDDETIYCRRCGKRLNAVQVPARISNTVITCPRCKTANPSGTSFCGYCSCPLAQETVNSNTMSTSTKKTETSKTNGCLYTALVVGGIIFAIFIGIMIIGAIGAVINNGKSDANNETTITNIKVTTINTETSQTETSQTEPVSIGDMSDPELIENFKNACSEIGMKVNEITSMTQLDNWVSGERYSFYYRDCSFLLYAYQDKSIGSINLGEVKIYERGYSSLNVDDYLVDSLLANELITLAQDKVRACLSYPDEADFPWIDGYGVGKFKDIYAVSGQVDASNAYGVKSTVYFYVEFEVNDDTAITKYLIVDGTVYAGEKSVIETEKRETTDASDAVDSSLPGITIEGGKQGEYGVIRNEDDYEYIDYHIPSGSYVMTASSSKTNVFLCSVAESKNSDGYLEPDEMLTYSFATGDESYEIEISDDYYLTIPDNVVVHFELS